MDEAEQFVESMLFQVNEGLGDTLKAIIGSPVKYIKIKSNLKDWTKAKLDIAAVEMDSIRKKEAAKEDPKGIDKEKLAAATKSKKEALNGKLKSIEDRLSQLATTDSLRAIVKLGKTKASLEANKRLLKIANAEELDALKLKIEGQIEKDEETIINTEDKLKTYAKKEEEKKDDTQPSKEEKKSDDKKEEPKKAKKEEPKKEDTKDEPKKEDTKEDDVDKKEDDSEDEKGDGKNLSKSAKKAKETIKQLEDSNKKLESDGPENQAEIEDNTKRASEAEAKLKKVKEDGSEEEIKKAEDELRDANDGVAAAQKRKTDAEVTIKANKDKIEKLRKDYNIHESVQIDYNNDIASRFREAMRNMK